MVLQDMNGNGQRSAAAERWLRQRGVRRTSVVRCIFGPPDKHMAIVERHEAEMDRKRREFMARYEPVGMSPAERSKFYENLIRTPSTSPSTSSHGNRSNAGHGSSANNGKADQQQHGNPKHGGGGQQSDEDRRN